MPIIKRPGSRVHEGNELLTQDLLKDQQCGNPACTVQHTTLVLSPGCHPGYPVFAHYDKRTGHLTLACCECDSQTAVILVAHSGVMH